MEFLAQMVQFWHVLQEKVRANMPSACAEAAAKMGMGGAAGEHEMSSYKTSEQPEGQFEAEYDEATGEFVRRPVAQASIAQDGEFDEFGGAKLTEWQAGWNVTNAIQVISSSFVSYVQTL